MDASKLIPRLDDGSKSYYKRVESFLDGDEHEDGDTQLFLKNVVEQIISDDARKVCCDKDGSSRAVERLLRHQTMDLATVQKLVEVLAAQCGELAANRSGSHVMEALMKAAAAQLSAVSADSNSSSVGDLQTLQEGFLSMCAVMRDRVHEFIVQPYASHVLSSGAGFVWRVLYRPCKQESILKGIQESQDGGGFDPPRCAAD